MEKNQKQAARIFWAGFGSDQITIYDWGLDAEWHFHRIKDFCLRSILPPPLLEQPKMLLEIPFLGNRGQDLKSNLPIPGEWGTGFEK